jgi:TetR/AcrR family acrAB operon transcriptional repressor
MENWLFMPESFDLKAEAPVLIDSFLEMAQFSPTLRLRPEELAAQPRSVESHPL